jgi:hypothetical protein
MKKYTVMPKSGKVFFHPETIELSKALKMNISDLNWNKLAVMHQRKGTRIFDVELTNKGFRQFGKLGL